MKNEKAFIGKGFGTEYICFTRYKMRGSVAEVHSEANKYDVTKYVNMAIANWIGERVGIMNDKKLSKEDFAELIGKDFNELRDKVDKEEQEDGVNAKTSETQGEKLI